MLFRKGRLARHLETLHSHIHMIGKLEDSRDGYEQDGLEGMVLAVNYEIMSHATRALTELRKAEELSRGDLDGAQMRDYLTPKVDLPALRRDQLNAMPSALVKELYEKFARSNKGKSASQVRYDAGRARS